MSKRGFGRRKRCQCGWLPHAACRFRGFLSVGRVVLYLSYGSECAAWACQLAAYLSAIALSRIASLSRIAYFLIRPFSIR